MTINTLPGTALTLGGYLRDRRSRLAPLPGPQARRRRTPGLRREEVASRAGVSVTWYTWLEQGRGGPPSDEVLERLARALELDASGREVLFLLGQQRPPPLRSTPLPSVEPAVQRVLDALVFTPAVVRTPTWDVVAWNAAAVALMGDYAAAPPRERNILRRMFGHAAMRHHMPDWEENARFALGVFRIDIARAGDSPEAEALVEELHAASADFRRLWAENGAFTHGVAHKRMVHPIAGPLALETTAFPVGGADGLTMFVFSPATPADAEAIASILSAGKA